MGKPDLDEYVRLGVRAMPDAGATAQRLSAVITILQTVQASLRDGQPDSVSRASASLTVALGALKLLDDQFSIAAAWVRSTGIN